MTFDVAGNGSVGAMGATGGCSGPPVGGGVWCSLKFRARGPVTAWRQDGLDLWSIQLHGFLLRRLLEQFQYV